MPMMMLVSMIMAMALNTCLSSSHDTPSFHSLARFMWAAQGSLK